MDKTTRIYVTLYALALCLAGGLVLNGCSSLRNEVDPGPLGLELPKLVVSSFLCPQDTVLTVKVTRSNTVVGDSISLLQTGNNVTDAIVTLSEGDRPVRLLYNNGHTPSDTATQPYYSVNARLLPIRAGRTYKLMVMTITGQRVSSTCTIPQAVDPTVIKFDSLTETQNRRQTQRYYVRVDWQDPAGQANYYQVAGIFRYTASGPNFREEKYNSLTFDDDNRGLLTDAGLEGTPMESGKAYLTLPSSTNGLTSFYNQFNTATVTINLLSIEQSYYRYQDAVIRQRRVRNNPFAEPVPVPTNIDGGLGCFAGYNNSTLTLKIK